jgi:hypothetical protein
MASTRYSRDADPADEPKGRGPLGVVTVLLVLYSAVVSTWLLFRPAPEGGGGGAGDAGPLVEQFDKQARRIRTEASEDLEKRLRSFKEDIAVAAKRVEDAGNAVKTVAESAVRRADETSRGAGAQVANLDEKVEDLSKSVATIRETIDGLTLAVRTLESRPIATAVAPQPVAPVAGPAAPTPAPTATPPEAPSDAPLTPEQIAANKENVKAKIADLGSGDLGKIFPAAVFLGKAGDLDAVEPLVKVVKEFKDPFGRTAAVQALGRLHACDGALVLIGLFVEKNTDVFLAAAQAFSKISGLDTGLSGDATKHEKTAAKDKWTTWWREHEAEIRKKWGQEKAVEEPPPPAMGEPPK